MGRKKAREIDPLQAKSIWKGTKKYWTYLCPHCRSERRLPERPAPGSLKNLARIALTTVFFTTVGWPIFGLKGLFAFFPFWAVFELVYRLRTRAALACPNCGFDPFLFMDDVSRAKTEVEAFWRAKFKEKGIPYPEKNQHNAPSQDKPTLTAPKSES